MRFLQLPDKRASQKPDEPRAWVHAIDATTIGLLPMCGAAVTPVTLRDVTPNGRLWDCPFCLLVVQRRYGKRLGIRIGAPN